MHSPLELLCHFRKTIIKYLKEQNFLAFYSSLQFTTCFRVLYLIFPITTTQHDGCNYCCYFLNENLKIREVYFEEYLRAGILWAISMFPKA